MVGTGTGKSKPFPDVWDGYGKSFKLSHCLGIENLCNLYCKYLRMGKPSNACPVLERIKFLYLDSALNALIFFFMLRLS